MESPQPIDIEKIADLFGMTRCKLFDLIEMIEEQSGVTFRKKSGRSPYDLEQSMEDDDNTTED